MAYIPKHFVTQELVYPEIYRKLGDKALLLMSDKILITADKLRDFFGVPVTINNWHTGGQFQNRGLRDKNSSVGALKSEHKLGNALDLDVQGKTSEQVRKIILANKNNEAFKFITRMELKVNWTHIDCKDIGNTPRIFCFEG